MAIRGQPCVRALHSTPFDEIAQRSFQAVPISQAGAHIDQLVQSLLAYLVTVRPVFEREKLRNFVEVKPPAAGPI